MAGVEVGTVYCGIAGEHVAGRSSHGMVSVTGDEIRTSDVARVNDMASNVSFGRDHELLHAIPQEYLIDQQAGISEPIGMTGSRLDVNVHIVTGAVSAVVLAAHLGRLGLEAREGEREPGRAEPHLAQVEAVQDPFVEPRAKRDVADAGLSEGDCLIAISTSGNSPNVIAAAMEARRKGAKVICLTGAGGKKLASISDAAVLVPAKRTARIQEAHITIAHVWCEMVDKAFAEEGVDR